MLSISTQNVLACVTQEFLMKLESLQMEVLRKLLVDTPKTQTEHLYLRPSTLIQGDPRRSLQV